MLEDLSSGKSNASNSSHWLDDTLADNNSPILSTDGNLWDNSINLHSLTRELQLPNQLCNQEDVTVTFNMSTERCDHRAGDGTDGRTGGKPVVVPLLAALMTAPTSLLLLMEERSRSPQSQPRITTQLLSTPKTSDASLITMCSSTLPNLSKQASRHPSKFSTPPSMTPTK